MSQSGFGCLALKRHHYKDDGAENTNLADLWQYAITSLRVHSSLLLSITAALCCQACALHGHLAQGRQQSGLLEVCRGKKTGTTIALAHADT